MTEIKGNFKLCTTDNHNVVVDMSSQCSFQSKKLIDGDNKADNWHILSKRSHYVHGKGYICKKKKI